MLGTKSLVIYTVIPVQLFSCKEGGREGRQWVGEMNTYRVTMNLKRGIRQFQIFEILIINSLLKLKLNFFFKY